MDWTERRSGLVVPHEYGDNEQPCQLCGCTQEDACYEGEPWAEPGLCASCAETGLWDLL